MKNENLKDEWLIGSFIEREGCIERYGEQKLKEYDCERKAQAYRQKKKNYCILNI
jgi:hypothetical protein